MRLSAANPIPLAKQPSGDLNGLLAHTCYDIRLNQLVIDDDTEQRLKQAIVEQTQSHRLAEFGLQPRRKLLFTGPAGTGKTMSAHILATELKLPLYTIVLDSLITRFMGETAAKLRLIFDHIQATRAVYLFDEFDAIGSQRGGENDVGEIRRVLNSFLMFVEQDTSQSIIVAATNHPELLDHALYRRFDDIIPFNKPKQEQIEQLIRNRLSLFDTSNLKWQELANSAVGLSAAEVTRACEDGAKEAVLKFDAKLDNQILTTAFLRRKTGGLTKS